MEPSRYVDSGNARLAVYVRESVATRTAPTLLLVHGYPDSSCVWDGVAEILAQRFRVVSYDVRGAGRSSLPPRVRDYALPQLAADLRAVVDAVSPRRPIHLLGHDWGSMQGWEAICDEAVRDRIASFTSISGPCVDHAMHWMRENAPDQRRAILGQFRRSWYMFMFQLPLLAPLMWKLILYRRWPRFLREMDGTVTEEFSPTRRSDGVNGIRIYRANMLQRLWHPKPRPTTVPVQLLVPRRDRFVQRQLLDQAARWAPVAARHEIEAGHWAPVSHPQWVADATAAFVERIEGSGVRAATG